MKRTVKIKLNTTPEHQSHLLATMQQYAACFNAVTAVGWEGGITNGVALHKVTYYPLRAEYPAMPAQLVISARMKASESIKSATARKKKGRKASRPVSKYGAVRYDARTYTYFKDQGTVSLSSVAGRLKVPDQKGADGRLIEGEILPTFRTGLNAFGNDS